MSIESLGSSDHLMREWNQGGISFISIVEGSNGSDGSILRRRVLNPTLDELLGPVKDLDVLDAGCGNGVHSKRLAMLGANVIGVDFSKSMLSLANQERASSNTHSLTQANIGNLPLAENSFDRVLTSLTIMWMNDTDLHNFSHESYRVLRVGGKLIVSILHPETNRTKLLLKGSIPVRDDRGRLMRVAKFPFRPNPTTWPKRINGTSYTFTYHDRTVQQYLEQFLKSGFTLDILRIPTLPENIDVGSRTEERQAFPEFVVMSFTK